MMWMGERKKLVSVHLTVCSSTEIPTRLSVVVIELSSAMSCGQHWFKQTKRTHTFLHSSCGFSINSDLLFIIYINTEAAPFVYYYSSTKFKRAEHILHENQFSAAAPCTRPHTCQTWRLHARACVCVRGLEFALMENSNMFEKFFSEREKYSVRLCRAKEKNRRVYLKANGCMDRVC